MKQSAKYGFFALIVACVLAVQPLYAKEKALEKAASDKEISAESVGNRSAMIGMDCAGKMQETVNLSVNFNMYAASYPEAKKKFDDKIEQLVQFAKQQDIQKFNIQSMNYNVYSQNNNDGMDGRLQINGSITISLNNENNAFKLAEFLTQQKMQVNVNVSKYNNNPMCAN